jgi:hypothetical protein
MTEKEAKTKWCPHVRWFGNAKDYDDMYPNRGDDAACIASECMSWRWQGGVAERGHGYCGLAGGE